MLRRINDQVVVVTGASSGIGRETALQFARGGACVVPAARNENALDELVQEIERLGGRASAWVTDVSDWDQVQVLANHAVDACGRIDTWVNNAVVSEYAMTDQVTNAEARRIIDVGLLGQIHGAQAALPYMKEQGHGAIVNVASVEAERGMALQSAYSAAKGGIKAFSEALRVELAKEHPGISVTLILPSSINTPLFEHSRSKLGVLPRPLPPVYEPKVVAESILFAAENPRKEIVVGGAGKLLTVLDRFAPEFTDWMLLNPGKVFEKQRSKRPDDGTDNLFEATDGSGAAQGSFGNKSKSTSLYTRYLEHYPNRKRALIGAAFAGSVALLRRGGRPR